MTKSEKLVEAARKTLRVVGWSPSRFGKWKECPQKVLIEDLLKLCPVCYAGRISGGFDGEPVVCDTCSKPQPQREALDRGNRLDAAVSAHLVGADGADVAMRALPTEKNEAMLEEVAAAHEVSLAEATRHPKIRLLVQKLRKSKGVTQQESIVLDSRWNRVSQFTKGAWGRLKLDVLRLTPKRAEIIDWKSGNIDKRTQQIRERADYADAMRAYQTAVLSVYPQAEASATMVFLDAPPKLENPTKSLPVLKRSELASAQKDWEQKISPMMKDEIFAPRPGFYCGYCPWQKAKGGPCRF